MKKSTIVFMSICVVFTSVGVINAGVLQKATNEDNGHVYYLLEEDGWVNSELEAIRLGGHLVTVNDPAEDVWVYETFKGVVEEIVGVPEDYIGVLGEDYDGGSLWTGLYKDPVEGWVWVSGETETYRNWAQTPTQPSGAVNEIYCGIFIGDWWALNNSGQWHDIADPEAPWDRGFGVVEVPYPLIVDIKPGACPNKLNIKSKGVLSVAVLGTEIFDVYDLDPASCLLEDVAPIQSSYEDVSTPPSDTGLCACTTAGPDGYLDLVLKFDAQEIMDTFGYTIDGDSFALTLTAVGNGVLWAGTDCVVIIEKVAKNPQNSLVGYWKLDEEEGTVAYDSSKNGNDGEVHGDPWWLPEYGRVNGGLSLHGGVWDDSDYVSLPIGSLLSQLTNSTFATWVNWSGQGGHWQRIFDFGSGEAVNMFLTPNSDDAGLLRMRFAITTGGGGGEERVTAPEILSTGWHHVCVTINADEGVTTLYLDGVAVAENPATTLTPSDLDGTTRNWLGRSQYSQDNNFNGVLDDFRIYDQTLSPDGVEAVINAK